MCGITGLFLRNEQPAEPSRLQKMTDSLAHRGPDDRGLWIQGPIGLGHRRLSILDLSAAGHQPMASHDGNAMLVFNGEIYNFRELRRELEQAGVEFRSHCDTEVIVEGYRHWGEDILPRLNGMFALAIVDRQHNRLLLARDRFGVKPLYYGCNEHGLIFGSEIKALLASGLIQKSIDHNALAEYLHYGSALGTRSFFDGIHQLEPGQTVRFDGQHGKKEHFCQLIPERESTDDFETASRTVLGLLEDAVQRQMVADVPVGIFLSGGIDSSAIAMLASRHAKQPLHTWSADFAFAKNRSELDLARLVAGKAGTIHHELHVVPDDLTGTLESLIQAHDQPFADAANIPLYLMCRELGNRTKVILQGDGGDELFAGYPRYNRLARRWRMRLLASVLLPFERSINKSSKLYRLLRSLHALTATPEDLRMALLMSQEPYASDPAEVLSPDLRQQMTACDPFTRYREMYARFRDHDAVQAMLYTDVSLLLPDIYFQKVDRPSMAHSVEVRVPMMDNLLADYALSLPSSIKLKRNIKKAVLKKALHGLVPDKVLYGRKRGFTVPVSRWLRGPLAAYLREILLDPSTQRSGLFDTVVLGQRIDQHLDETADYGKSLYKFLNLALWHKQHFNS